MGGQACVLYGAAEFSRDLDLMSQRDTVTDPAEQLASTQLNPRLTLRGLLDLLADMGAPDPEFADDLEAIQREQPSVGTTF